MRSRRSWVAVGTVIGFLSASGVAMAQGTGSGSGLDLGMEILVRFVVGLVINLLLGGALYVFGQRYGEALVADISEDPGGAFIWGLGVGIGIPILLTVLALTIIGLIVAIPGALVLLAVGLVGNAVTIAWIGNVFDGGGKEVNGRTVGIGAVMLAVAGAIPILGNLVTSILGFFGIGVVGRELYRSWRGEPSPRARTTPRDL